MDIILKEDVENLGHKFDIVSVKAGYARNFLIPQGMAVAATKSARKVAEEVARQQAHKAAKALEQAQGLAEAIGKLKLSIGAKAGENGKIFGSVNAIQLSEAIQKAGYDVERKQINLSDDHIKTLGSYTAEIKLHKGVKATVEFEVVAD
ncbi:MAG: 50S ribosomal protein L9 [Flavobacteriales bacterium]